MKTLLTSFFACILLCQGRLSAQSLTVTGDTTICAGQQVQLQASGGGSSYTWSPSTGLNNANSANPVATPSQTTTYVVSSQVTVSNLVTNGDFSAGNTGFTSQYTYQLPPNNQGQQRYWVGDAPASFSSNWPGCGDHSPGSAGNNNMLMANGSENLNTMLWCETLNVIPNSTYNLSGYITTFNQTNLPKGRWSVNGVPLGTAQSTVFTCIWSQFTATWNSGVNTIATFCVFDPDTFANGNDLAIDDLSITATLNLTDTVIITVATPPVVALGNDTMLCTGGSLLLNAANANSTYLWSNNATSPSITVNTTGQYWVRVNNGCISADTINANFIAAPQPFNLGNDTAYCGSFSRVLNTARPGTIWSTGAVATQITVNTAGTYWATDSNQCGVQRDSIVLGQSPAPAPQLGSDTAICSAQALLLDAGVGSAYSWNTTASSPTINVSTPGTYSVTVTNAFGCTGSDEVLVSAYTVPLNLQVTNTSCGSNNGAVVADVAGAHSPVTYLWNTSDTSSALTALAAGSYNVTVTDVNGCTATGAATVNPSGSNSVTVTAATTTICAGDSTEICAPAGYNAYQWNTGDTGMCMKAYLAGNYYVTVTDAGACTATSNHLAVSTFPQSPVSVTVKGDTLVAFNGIAYQWFLNGNVISGATNAVYVALQSGSYSVQITDTNGCGAVSNNITLTVGISTVAGNNLLAVYPNPSISGYWQLTADNVLLGAELEMIDNNGKLVYRGKITSTSNEIRPVLPAGIYYLRIKSGTAIYNLKLIKL